MKRKIRLTESDLHIIVKESLNKVIKEYYETPYKNFYNDDDVNQMSIFNPIDKGYISSKTFEEFLNEKYDEMLDLIIAQNHEITDAYNTKNYKFFRYNDFYLFEDCYSSYSDFTKGIDNEINFIINSYLEVIQNDDESFNEINDNDYDYSNKNYDGSNEYTRNTTWHKQIDGLDSYFFADMYNSAKCILFNKKTLKLIQSYFKLRQKYILDLSRQ